MESVTTKHSELVTNTAQKMKFLLRIWSHLLEKSLMENFIFCAMKIPTQAKLYIKNSNSKHMKS